MSPPPVQTPDLRVALPVRDQLEWTTQHLDSLLPERHPARAIWAFLERLDLSAFYSKIKAAIDRPGRAATDPRVLLGLWLFATTDGIGSARKLAKLCGDHDAYRWIRGGVPVNYHLLSDFRVAHQEALDELMTQIIAAMMAEELITLYRVSQDGMRVRANAGAVSFRRKNSLTRCQQEAREQIERLAQERAAPDPQMGRRQRAARERAAREREGRISAALGHLPALQAAKDRQKQTQNKAKRKKVTEPRVSTTDPEARVLKMPDGGFRPAYNIQLATDTDSGVIIGMKVVNAGDEGQAAPMEDQVATRTGKHPGSYLMDGGFATREDITTLERRGISVYAPVRLPSERPEEERYRPRYGDTPEVKAWRARMATPEAQATYRQRAATAEWSNAQLRQHGVTQFAVTGIAKTTMVTLLAVIAHNLLRWATLAS
jgi:transposase